MPDKVLTAGNWDKEDRNIYFLAQSSSRGMWPLACKNGRWNGDEMREFFALPEDEVEYSAYRPIYRYMLTAVNDIDEVMEAVMSRLTRIGVKFFLDSGVFNLASTFARKYGVSHDIALGMAPGEIEGFDALFEKYTSIMRRWDSRAWGFVEIDQGGRENKIKTRARLEAMGFRPIPVFHPLLDGWDYFDELASRYDRICMGNIVQADAATRVRLLTTAYERRARYPGLWIHYLGYTPDYRLVAMPTDSADSSTWMGAVRWGEHKSRSALKVSWGMGDGWTYILGNPEEGDGWMKSVAMEANEQLHFLLNWRESLAQKRLVEDVETC